MKKINWTEIAIAAPMALAFGSLAGAYAMLYVSVALGLLIGAAKMAEKKLAVIPIVVKAQRSRG